MSTPARTASSYKSAQTRAGRVALAAACGAFLVAGCSQGVGGGLSSNLPPAGGGGLLSFTSVAMPDGIAGRAYSKVAVTSVETQAKTTFPISPAVASGTAPLASCTVSAGTLPPGMNAALTVDSTGAGCVISGTPSAAAAGNTYQFTIQALDSNSPPRAAAQTFTMRVRPEFTVTAPAAIVAGVLPAGVQGRTYGQIPGNAAAMTAMTNLSATTGNGAVGAKNYCSISVTPALPALTVTQVAGTNDCQLQGTAALPSAGSYKVTVAITDNPIFDPETNLQAVPANTIAAASNATLNVATPLKIVAADSVSAAPPPAVQGRAYGTGTGCSGGACSPLTYVSSGGLPAVEPADSYLFSSSGALTAAGINCAASATSTVAKTTCSGTAAGTGGTFAVTVDDPGNLATPSGSASSTTASTGNLSLTVNSALSLGVSPDPQANPAVQGRDYGVATDTCAGSIKCAAPTYTPTGGLGTYTFSITGAAPAGITCAPNAGTTAVVCSGTPTATGASTFGVSASDVANASTPSATTAVVSKTLTVNGALTLSPPAGLPPAVNGRAFGSGAGCSGGNCVPAVFTISGGLGAYSANATVVSAPGTWSCPLSGSQYNCSSTNVISGTPTLSITASDGANAATPSAAGASVASASVGITVMPALAVTPPGAVADAVAGRAYGTGTGCTGAGGNCVPLQYVVTGGLGTYGAAALTAGSNTFSCSGSGTYLCSIATIGGPGTQTLSLTVSDVGNASTPSAPVSDTTKSINILPAVTLTNANLGTTWPPAVQGRSYATAGFTSDQFTAANGIPPYTFLPPSGFPTGFTCTPAAATDTCSATAVGGAANYSPQITVHDAGNGSTPASTVATDPGSQLTASLTVKSPLTLAVVGVWPPAVTGRPYGTGSGCSGGPCLAQQFSVTGGLGGYSNAAMILTAPGGRVDEWSCSLNGAKTDYDCSATAIAGAAGSANLQISATDTANSTTPAATVTSDAGSQDTITLTVDSQVTLTLVGSLPDAVNGRSYGLLANTNCTGGPIGCQPAQFHVTGGLGGYAANAAISSAPGGVTATWSCVLSGSNYNCSSSNVSGSGPSTLTVTATDVANVSTPAATTATDPGSQAPAAILVHDPMTFTPPGTINDAVVGRTYGFGTCPGGPCTGLTYTITGGLGNYGTGSLTAGSDTFSCSFSLPNYSCTKNVAISSAPGSYALTMSAPETGNASTPSFTATDTSRILVVDPVLSISETQTSTWEPAVKSRSYGNNGTPNQVTAAGGIPPYTYTPSGFPPSIVCTPLNTSSPTTCSSSSVTDTPMTYTVSVQAIDTGNGSTPPASAPVATGPDSLTIDSPLTFNPVSALPNALENYPYPTNAGTTVVSETGGLGGNTWIDPNNAASGACTVPSGPSPLGLQVVSASSTTATITGTPVISSPGTYIFQICVTDTANTMTPAGSANSSNISLDVVPSYAAIAEKGADQIEFFDTSAKADSTVVPQPISTGSGSAPYGVAFSPNGRYAYITLSGSTYNDLAVYDTITNLIVGSPTALTSGCVPHGVAATATYIFVACNGIDDVDVVNASTLAVSALSTGATGGGAEGVAISADGTRVYVTLSSLNELFVINNSGSSPAALSGAGITNPSPLTTTYGTIPMGIAVAGPGAGTVTYIAKQGASSTVPDGVEIVDLTSNSFPDVAGAGFTTSSDSTAKPTSVAITPDGHRVYVTLNGLDKFAVVDNTASPPAQLSGSPFTLSGTGTASEGVTIPPATPFQAFVAESGTNKLGVIDDSATAPAEDSNSPYALSGTAPFGIASTPAPQ